MLYWLKEEALPFLAMALGVLLVFGLLFGLPLYLSGALSQDETIQLYQSDFRPDSDSSTDFVASETQSQFERLTKDDFVGVNEFHNSVVKIINDFGYGSGFVVSPNKVVTCAHCLTKTETTYITDFMIGFTYEMGGSSLEARYMCQLEEIDVEKDIAVGIILPNSWTKENAEPLDIIVLDDYKNQLVDYVGYQEGGFVTRQGEIVGFSNDKKNYEGNSFILLGDMIEVRMLVECGNSGGPILYQSKVVGMVSLKNQIFPYAYCVEPDYILDCLD